MPLDLGLASGSLARRTRRAAAALLIGAASSGAGEAQTGTGPAASEWEGSIETRLAEAKDGCADFDLAVEGRDGIIRLGWKAPSPPSAQARSERRRLGVDASASQAGTMLIIPSASCTVIVTVRRRAQP
jgi:hypothetical protein